MLSKMTETGRRETAARFLYARKGDEAMARQSKVAQAEEVRQALTGSLRREEEVKPSEVLRAAELLGKRYGLFGEQTGAPETAPSIVVDLDRRDGA